MNNLVVTLEKSNKKLLRYEQLKGVKQEYMEDNKVVKEKKSLLGSKPVKFWRRSDTLPLHQIFKVT